MVATGCTGGDDGGAATTAAPATTTANTPPTSQAPEQDQSATTLPPATTEALAPITTLRLAAPPDCATNPACADGLARVYGIDVSDLIVPTEPGAPMAAAVLEGAADVGVIFSDDPALDDPSLVQLDDDRTMVAAENIVPVAKMALVSDRGDALRDAIDQVTDSLNDDELRSALAAVRDGTSPEEAARTFAAATGEIDPAADAPIRIGAEAFPTARVLANVYAMGLSARGYPAVVVPIDGFRALEIAYMIDDEIDLSIQYSASLLEYLDGFQGRSSADSAATLSALRELLALAEYEAFAASPLQSRNTFVMRKDIAEANGIANLSDLIPLAPPADVAPAPGDLPELQDPFAIFGPGDLRIGSVGPEVRELQELLSQIDYYGGPLNGIFEEPTRRAVAAFQVDSGSAPDGIVGPITLVALREAVDAGATAITTELSTTGDSSGNEIHLTFDDGPSGEFTPQILDLLAQYDAKAVFFSIGNQVEGGAELLQRAVSQGHRIGNHTWSHASLDGMSADTFAGEVGRTQDAISAAINETPTCLRPPYGATDDQTRDRAAGLGLSVELWNIDPQDWSRPGVENIVSNVVEHAGPGAVVLMHDGGGNRDQTIAALGQILERLSADGYRFTPIPGC